jgi:hypothetical protein
MLSNKWIRDVDSFISKTTLLSLASLARRQRRQRHVSPKDTRLWLSYVKSLSQDIRFEKDL